MPPKSHGWRICSGVLLLLSWLLFLPSHAEAFDRDYDSKDPRKLWVAEMDSWQEKLSGTLKVKGLKADLGTDGNFSDCNRMALRLVVPVSRVTNAVLAWNTFEHAGRLRKDVDFHGRKYASGARLQLQTSLFEVTGARELIRFTGAYLEGLYGLKIAQMSTEIKGYSSLGAYQHGDWDGFFPVPFLGVAGGARVNHHLQIRGSLKLVSAGAGGGLLQSYDADVSAAVRLNRDTNPREYSFLLGYRRFSLDANSSDGSVGLGYTGPFFGLLLRFP